MALPSQIQAVVAVEGKKAEVKTVPLPTPGPGEVLVKVSAVSINPTDWKHVAFLAEPGSLVGCDFVGTVADSNGTDLKEGTRVAGFTHGGKYPDRGSFAEYAIAVANVLVKVPDETPDEVAAATGVAVLTTVQVLFNRLEFPIPDKEKLTQLPTLNADSPQLLVWSGATAVGQIAIQFGRALGYHVITTASPKNFALLKSYGAAETYDYREEGLPEKISKEHPKLSAALDCISENGTQALAVRSLGASGGKVIVLLGPDKEAAALRNGVQIVHTLAYSLNGRPYSYGKAVYDEATVKSENEKIQPFTTGGIIRHMYKHGLLKGNNIKKMDGGLAGTIEGMEYLQDGKVSAEKLVYTF